MSLSASSFSSFGARLLATATACFPATITFSGHTILGAARLGKTTRLVESTGVAMEIDGTAILPFAYGGAEPEAGQRITIGGQDYRISGVQAQEALSSWEIWLEQTG